MARFPFASDSAAWQSATSGASGLTTPRGPKGESTRGNPEFRSRSDPATDPVTTAGSPRAAASILWARVRIDQCSTSTSPDSYPCWKIGFGEYEGKLLPE